MPSWEVSFAIDFLRANAGIQVYEDSDGDKQSPNG